MLYHISFYNHGSEESVKVSVQKKMMSIGLKRDILEKLEQGVRVTDLARQYERSTSMICTEGIDKGYNAS